MDWTGPPKEINGEWYIFGKVGGFYGWYKLVPVETPPNDDEIVEG